MSVISFPKKSNLPDRESYQWGRRLFHLLGGFFFLALFFSIKDRSLFLLVLVTGTLMATTLDFLRTRIPILREIGQRLFGSLMREQEDRQLTGMPFYALGCTLSFILFPPSVAILAVLYLAFGDPLASIVGVYYQRKKPAMGGFSKSWAGSTACFAACFLLSFLLMPLLFDGLQYQDWRLWLLAILGGLSAAFAEFLPLRTDDNLSLPIVSGSFLWLFAALLNGGVNLAP